MMATRPSPRSRPGISRRTLLRGAMGIGAGASLASLGGSVTMQRAAAQDPFTYITAMPATTDLGQIAGQPAAEIAPVEADGALWDAYIQMPIKEGQDYSYTCEFDSSEIIINAYGGEITLDEQLEIVGNDQSVEPYYVEEPDGVKIYGGDIWEHYSGDYRENFLARSTCNAMRKAFEHVGLTVEVTETREKIENALLAGYPVYFKSTVDFLDWVPTTWITPSGEEFPVVLGNDHALIVMAFNEHEVVIRDPLGPTTSNTMRPYQYRVSWERYLAVIAAQGDDAISVAPGADDDDEVLGDGTGGA